MTRQTRGAILITGAARRIGADMARALARDGWFICIHHNTSGGAAADLLREICDAGGAGKLIKADLADAQTAQSLIQDAMKDAPEITVLINNASLFEFDDIGSLTAEALDRHFAVNLRAPILLSQAFLKLTAPQRDGCIVNMLDNKVFAVNPDYLSYTDVR